MIAQMRPAALIGVLVMGLLSGCALPLVSEQEIAIQAGAQFEQMREEIVISSDIGARRYVRCVADAIIEMLEPPYSELEWDVELFDDEAINAFAMPGGKIGVFTGILAVAENQDQLGAVLGHEVAHVTEKHSVGRANRTMTAQLGVAAAGALGGSIAGEVAQMGTQLGILLPYGRGQESQADVVGLAYMADAGFDPRASVQLWRNMAERNKGAPPEFLSTHPSSGTRIEDLARQLPPSLVRYDSAREAGKSPDCQR